jgi:SAM-dependent methyltransferase
MTLDPEAEAFLGQMRKRWEKRAVVDHRFFTESLNFNDADAWDARAEVETARYLEGLEDRFMAAGRLLEIGCGPARLLRRLEPHFAFTLGVDISPTMLRHARDALADRPHAALCLSGGADLAFLRDRTFDVVLMHAVAIHMPGELIARYLHEGYRVLETGGHFRFTLKREAAAGSEAREVDAFVSECVQTVPDGGEALVHGLDYAGHAFADDEIHGFLEAFGFGEVRVEQVGLEMFGVAVRKSA